MATHLKPFWISSFSSDCPSLCPLCQQSSLDKPTWIYLICVHSQMDPKLRPSFADIVKTLEEILNRLRNEDSERDRKFLNLDNNERKPKGKCLYCTNIAGCSQEEERLNILKTDIWLYMVLFMVYEWFYTNPENYSGATLYALHCRMSFGEKNSKLFLKVIKVCPQDLKRKFRVHLGMGL